LRELPMDFIDSFGENKFPF